MKTATEARTRTAANINASEYWDVFDTLMVWPCIGGAEGTVTLWVMFQDCSSELAMREIS